MNDVKIHLKELDVLLMVKKNVQSAFLALGEKVAEIAQASMKPQGQHSYYDAKGNAHTTWLSDTPKGEPPRIRTGDLANNIEAAMSGNELVLWAGPVWLPHHNTDCLQRLEVDHPFMRPALAKAWANLPEIWKKAVS